MKTNALKNLRRRLRVDEPVYGLWVTLESASITEMAVGLGLDWVVIDAEHGHLGWHNILEHVRAAVRSDTVVLVRVQELNAALIKRALDIGADGVVVPWIETADDLRRAVSYAHYPPAGTRGVGAERATCWGECFAEHVAESDRNVMVVPMIESVESGRNVRELIEVPGVDVFFFGPADFSSTAGYPGQWEGPGVADVILAAKDVIRAAGRHCGVVAGNHDGRRQRYDQGFRMLGLGLDGGLLLRSLHDALAASGRDRKLTPALDAPREANATITPVAALPEAMCPDRPEVMNNVGAGPVVEIEQGVRFECLVGGHNQARGLTTGIVTFGGAGLPYHCHPFGESITLFRGRATVEVEGRLYELEPLDNITLPRRLAHRVVNNSASDTAVFNIMMASDAPTRTLVVEPFTTLVMPADSTGYPRREYLTRFKTADRYKPGPSASFIDFFNSELIPDIEMSGGYGVFQHGGRLPAHVHDFDESICIIEGTATCVVEGREYVMSGCATALQPRGRVHYFINHTHEPMAMLWVYAGPMPRRIIVDESCATAAGNPWRASAPAEVIVKEGASRV